MKIIIEHGHTKREIDGPLNLCGSGAHLRHLAQQILAKVPKDYYGWVSILPYEVQPSMANTPPVAWDAPANTESRP